MVVSLTHQNNQLKIYVMTYTASQIERAKKAYTSFANYRTVESFDPQYVGNAVANQRCEFHNNIVSKIKNNDAETVKEWKLFFLTEAAKSDQREAAKKAKLAANKEASADVLAPIKSAKRIGEFGKWLNDAKNPFRKEHFSKKYTQESVNAFLNN